MNSNSAILSYQQAAARGASSLGQIIALYDTILRDFARAQVATQAGNIEARVYELNHALLVIAHLQNVLDHERGGEAATQFEQFYNVTRGMIVQANIDSRGKALESLIEMYSSLRQAWQQVETHSPGFAMIDPLTKPPVAVPGAIDTPADLDDNHKQSRWSA